MPNAKIETWVAAVGFFVLAVMLCIEGVAIFGSYAAKIGERRSSATVMMHFRE
jgi:hypothetical protein